MPDALQHIQHYMCLCFSVAQHGSGTLATIRRDPYGSFSFCKTFDCDWLSCERLKQIIPCYHQTMVGVGESTNGIMRQRGQLIIRQWYSSARALGKRLAQFQAYPAHLLILSLQSLSNAMPIAESSIECNFLLEIGFSDLIFILVASWIVLEDELTLPGKRWLFEKIWHLVEDASSSLLWLSLSDGWREFTMM